MPSGSRPALAALALLAIGCAMMSLAAEQQRHAKMPTSGSHNVISILRNSSRAWPSVASPGEELIKQQAQVLASLKNKLRGQAMLNVDKMKSRTAPLVALKSSASSTEAGGSINRTALAASASSVIPVRSKSGRALSRMQPSKRQTLDEGAESSRSRRNEDPWFLDAEPPYPLQPYRFVYNVKGRDGQTEQYRQEVGDGKHLTGSYGYVLPDGIYRHVDYVADDRGFRAYIRTSEPGTSNQNPSNVVMSANPLIVAPGVSYASQRADAPDSLTPALISDAARIGALTQPNARTTTWQTASAADDQQERLVRRPPGSIVGNALGVRNFTSFAYTTPSPLEPAIFTNSHELLPRPTATPALSTSLLDAGDTWRRRNESHLLPASTYTGRVEPWEHELWRQRHLLSHRLGSPAIASPAIAADMPTRNVSRASTILPYQWALDPLPALQPPAAPIAPIITRAQPVVSADLPSDSFSRHFTSPQLSPSGTKLAYDRPLADQRDRPLGAPLKMAYDNKHAFHPDSPYLNLERSRGIAQLDQLGSLGHRFGPLSGAHLHSLPRLPVTTGTTSGSEQPSTTPQLDGSTLAPLNQQVNSEQRHESKSSSSTSEEQEERHHHRLQQHSSGTTSSDGSPLQQLTSSKEHQSGTKSGSMRHYELHQHSNLPNQLPPPPPAFENARRPQSANGIKGNRPIHAPYTELHAANLDSHLDETSRPDGDTPAAAAAAADGLKGAQAPVHRLQDFAPRESGGDEQQIAAATKGGSVSSGKQRAKPDELYRHGMLINHLRSMQQTIGLPQPPRSPFDRTEPATTLDGSRERRRVASTTSGLSLVDQMVSARMGRVESLLAASRHLSSDTNPSSSASTGDGTSSVVRAGEPQLLASAASSSGRTGDSLAVTPQEGATDRQASRLASSGGQLKAASQASGGGQVVDFDMLAAGGAGNGSVFDARRLPTAASMRKATRLQAEKVSELEKFQQRLRAQQLQAGQTPTTTTTTAAAAQQVAANNHNQAAAATASPLASTRDTVSGGGSKANAQVRYDEEPSSSSGESKGGKRGDLRVISATSAAIGNSAASTASSIPPSNNLRMQRGSLSSSSTTDNNDDLDAVARSRENELDTGAQGGTTLARGLLQNDNSTTSSKENKSDDRASDLAKEIGRWPSIKHLAAGGALSGNRSHEAASAETFNSRTGDSSVHEFKSRLVKALISDAKIGNRANPFSNHSIATSSDGATSANNSTAKPEVESSNVQPAPRGPANTINLDFINSVTALSVDSMNPFALTSVNPAVQRSPSGNESRLSPHRLGDFAPASSTGNGIATSNARYFSSPELLAALDYHERRDTSAQLRSLLPAHHQAGQMDQVAGGGGSRETTAAHTWASNHRNSPTSMPTATSGAPYTLSAQATTNSAPLGKSLFPATTNLYQGGGGGGGEQDNASPLMRDGFHVRDRAVQVDNHRFYEVVTNAAPSASASDDASRMRWPSGESNSAQGGFVAFRDAQLSIPASRQ